MTLAVTVQTGDLPAEVFALTVIEGMPFERGKMLDFGQVPPHSEMDFSVFDGASILVREIAASDGGFGDGVVWELPADADSAPEMDEAA